MDPYALVALAPPVVWVGIVWWRSRRPRRVEQPVDEVALGRLKAQYQRDPSVPPTDARLAPSPLSAISVCPLPGCDWVGWHEWVAPDPERCAETVTEWYWDPGSEGEIVSTWGGLYQSTEAHPAGWRMKRRVVGMDEELLEVVRVCPECETRWGATASRQVVW